MITTSITQRISLLAIVAMLPASLLVGETSKRTAVEKESTQLFGEMERWRGISAHTPTVPISIPATPRFRGKPTTTT